MSIHDRYQFQPITAPDQEIEELNEEHGFTGARAFEPTAEAIERINTQSQANADRLSSWVQHPDQRVPLALVESVNRSAKPRWWRGDTEELAIALLERALIDAREQNVRMNPLLDKLTTYNSLLARNRATPDTYQKIKKIESTRVTPMLEDVEQITTQEDLSPFTNFDNHSLRRELLTHPEAGEKIYRYGLEGNDTAPPQVTLDRLFDKIAQPALARELYKEHYIAELSDILTSASEAFAEGDYTPDPADLSHALQSLFFMMAEDREFDLTEGVDFDELADQLDQLTSTPTGVRFLTNAFINTRHHSSDLRDNSPQEAEPFWDALYDGVLGRGVEDIEPTARNLDVATRLLDKDWTEGEEPSQEDIGRLNAALRISREHFHAAQQTEHDYEDIRSDEAPPYAWQVSPHRRYASNLAHEALYTVARRDLAQYLDDDVLESIAQDDEWIWETVANFYGRQQDADDLIRFDGPEALTSRVQQVIYKRALEGLEHTKDSNRFTHAILSNHVLTLLDRGDLSDQQVETLWAQIDEAPIPVKVSFIHRLNRDEYSDDIREQVLNRIDADTWKQIFDEIDDHRNYFREHLTGNIYTVTAQYYPLEDWDQVPGMLSWAKESEEVSTQQLEKLAEEFDWEKAPVRSAQEPGSVTGEGVGRDRRERLMDLIEEEVDQQQAPDGRSR